MKILIRHSTLHSATQYSCSRFILALPLISETAEPLVTEVTLIIIDQAHKRCVARIGLNIPVVKSGRKFYTIVSRDVSCDMRLLTKYQTTITRWNITLKRSSRSGSIRRGTCRKLTAEQQTLSMIIHSPHCDYYYSDDMSANHWVFSSLPKSYTLFCKRTIGLTLKSTSMRIQK